jgi:hypothetical protein
MSRFEFGYVSFLNPAGSISASRRAAVPGRQSKIALMDILRWGASLSGICAALIVAANLGKRWSGIGFVIFTGSSFLWITASVLRERDPLLMQNIVLFAINLFGVYRYLGPGRERPD